MTTLPASNKRSYIVSQLLLSNRLNELVVEHFFDTPKQKEAHEAVFKVDYKWFNPTADASKVAGIKYRIHQPFSMIRAKHLFTTLMNDVFGMQQSGVIQMQIVKTINIIDSDRVIHYYDLVFQADSGAEQFDIALESESGELLDKDIKRCDIIRVDVIEGQKSLRNITLLKDGLEVFFEQFGYKDCGEFYESYLMLSPRLRVKHNMDYSDCRVLYNVLKDNSALSSDIEQCLKDVVSVNTLALAQAYGINLSETVEPNMLDTKIIDGYECHAEGAQIDRDTFDWFSSIVDNKLQNDDSVDWYRLYFNGKSLIKYKNVA